jgi:hypothetical protein
MGEWFFVVQRDGSKSMQPNSSASIRYPLVLCLPQETQRVLFLTFATHFELIHPPILHHLLKVYGDHAVNPGCSWGIDSLTASLYNSLVDMANAAAQLHHRRSSAALPDRGSILAYLNVTPSGQAHFSHSYDAGLGDSVPERGPVFAWARQQILSRKRGRPATSSPPAQEPKQRPGGSPTWHEPEPELDAGLPRSAESQSDSHMDGSVAEASEAVAEGPSFLPDEASSPPKK